jgi:hypothetical protein
MVSLHRLRFSNSSTTKPRVGSRRSPYREAVKQQSPGSPRSGAPWVKTPTSTPTAKRLPNWQDGYGAFSVSPGHVEGCGSARSMESRSTNGTRGIRSRVFWETPSGYRFVGRIEPRVRRCAATLGFVVQPLRGCPCNDAMITASPGLHDRTIGLSRQTFCLFLAT